MGILEKVIGAVMPPESGHARKEAVRWPTTSTRRRAAATQPFSKRWTQARAKRLRRAIAQSSIAISVMQPLADALRVGFHLARRSGGRFSLGRI